MLLCAIILCDIEISTVLGYYTV